MRSLSHRTLSAAKEIRQLIDDSATKVTEGHEKTDAAQKTMAESLELVRRGMGWTVVDFLTAKGLDPAQMVAQELHELAPMSLYSYHARAFPPGLQATRMLGMLPALLHEALQPNPKATRR